MTDTFLLVMKLAIDGDCRCAEVQLAISIRIARRLARGRVSGRDSRPLVVSDRNN